KEDGGLIVREWPAAEPEPAATDTRITKLAFRNRFTQAEKAALELASVDDPTGTEQQRMQSAALRAYLKDVEAAAFINLAGPAVDSGVRDLEAMGLLEAGRADEIITAPIQPDERP